MLQKHQLGLEVLAEDNRMKLVEATLIETGLQDDDADVKVNVQEGSLCDLAVAEIEIGCLRIETWKKI